MSGQSLNSKTNKKYKSFRDEHTFIMDNIISYTEDLKLCIYTCVCVLESNNLYFKCAFPLIEDKP